ncbi:MAG: hypothetical protein WB507_03055 [Solirubrobacterales bacterium]
MNIRARSFVAGRAAFRKTGRAARASGRVVVLLANVPGSKRWITFRDQTTGGQGDFDSGFRFTVTTRTTTYRFRALIPSQASYPWVEGTSRPVRVRVKG